MLLVKISIYCKSSYLNQLLKSERSKNTMVHVYDLRVSRRMPMYVFLISFLFIILSTKWFRAEEATGNDLKFRMPTRENVRRFNVNERDISVERPLKTIDGGTMEMQYKRRRLVPDVHILGVMKSGTETLHTFLGVHPQIFTQTDLPPFFFPTYLQDLESAGPPFPRHDQLILGAPGGFCVPSPGVRERMYNINRDVKLILILRNPVERTISHISMNRVLHPELRNTTVEEAIFSKSKPGVIDSDLVVVAKSIYYRWMFSVLQWFPLRQILILEAENFIKNPVTELAKVEQFLGLPHKLTSKVIYYSKSRGFHCYFKDGKRKCMPKGKGRPHVEVSKSTRQKLECFFRPYNQKFYNLVNRTFNWDDGITGKCQ